MSDIITYDEVKKILSMHHEGGTSKRELIIHKTSDKDAVLWLSGTPPKGYCIAANGIVSLYNVWGKRFKIYQETRLDFGGVCE